ncbi:MAG: hypothetical protein OXU54_07290 [Gammaproteobacteria bacterium]|nr:hypothetical protein [Gammaproteobacteria bacterium]
MRRRLALALLLAAPGAWAGGAAEGDMAGDVSGGGGGARPPCAAGDVGDMSATETAVGGLEDCAAGGATAAERERRLLLRHEQALDDTDDILLKARLELERMQEGEDSAAAENGGMVSRELGRLSDLEESAPDADAAAGDGDREERLPPDLSGAQEAEAGGAAAPKTAGAVGRGGRNLPSAPADVGDGQDDDIVARQLREAAAKEPDPEVREKLWDEYRRYKKGG